MQFLHLTELFTQTCLWQIWLMTVGAGRWQSLGSRQAAAASFFRLYRYSWPTLFFCILLLLRFFTQQYIGVSIVSEASSCFSLLTLGWFTELLLKVAATSVQVLSQNSHTPVAIKHKHCRSWKQPKEPGTCLPAWRDFGKPAWLPGETFEAGQIHIFPPWLPGKTSRSDQIHICSFHFREDLVPCSPASRRLKTDLTFWMPRTMDLIPISTRSPQLTFCITGAKVEIKWKPDKKDLGDDAFLPLPPREILESGQVGHSNKR